DTFGRSMADPRVKDVFARWSRCLGSHGFSAPSPMEAGVGLASIQAEKPDAIEIKAALADVACKKDTNLVGVWFTVESEYQATAIARRQADFDALAKARDADLARTAQLLPGGARRR
ncbi:MAG: hypothetical protein ACRD0H_29195, partial [Actinomycetes bacterium]